MDGKPGKDALWRFDMEIIGIVAVFIGILLVVAVIEKVKRQRQDRAENELIASAVKATLEKIAEVNPEAVRNIGTVSVTKVRKE
jgi:ABC-type transport system involved in cytochrome bd biosynthesis fused ATPase/permease subunit